MTARAFELFLPAGDPARMTIDTFHRAAGLIAQVKEIEGETPPLLALETYANVQQVKAASTATRGRSTWRKPRRGRSCRKPPDSHYGHAILGLIAYEHGLLPEAVGHCGSGPTRSPRPPISRRHSAELAETVVSRQQVVRRDS